MDVVTPAIHTPFGCHRVRRCTRLARARARLRGCHQVDRRPNAVDHAVVVGAQRAMRRARGGAGAEHRRSERACRRHIADAEAGKGRQKGAAWTAGSPMLPSDAGCRCRVWCVGVVVLRCFVLSPRTVGRTNDRTTPHTDIMLTASPPLRAFQHLDEAARQRELLRAAAEQPPDRPIDEQGHLPLHLAAWHSAPPPVIESLVGAHPEAAGTTASQSDWLPLHIALQAEADLAVSVAPTRQSVCGAVRRELRLDAPAHCGTAWCSHRRH